MVAIGKGELIHKWQAQAIRETVTGPSRPYTADESNWAIRSWFNNEGLDVDRIYREVSKMVAKITYRGAPSNQAGVFWAM